MRKFIVNMFLFGGMCGLLAALGFHVMTWQFWIFVIGMLGLQVNNSID